MIVRILLFCWLGLAMAPAAKLPEWYVRKIDDADVEVRLVQDLLEITQLAGSSMDGEVILVEMKIRPLYGSQVLLRRDDFLMRSRSNNDTSPAQSPERVAGGSVLALGSEGSSSSSGVMKDTTGGPIWGGVPGTGQRPRRLDAPGSGIGVGSQTSKVQTIEQQNSSENSVESRLQSMELQLESSKEQVSGFLFFEIPAKVKRKHLELSYDGQLGVFLIEFKKPE